MDKFRYILYVRATLTTDAPMRIGGATDAPFQMALDENNQPFLPGTTIAGACKAFLKKEYPEEYKRIEQLLGSREYDSKLYCFDGYTKKSNIEIRTGIRQDAVRGGSQKGAKYEIAYVAKGVDFDICFQCFSQTEEERKSMEKYIRTSLSAMQGKLITFGSHKTNGAGSMSVSQVDTMVCDLFTVRGLRQYIGGMDKALDESARGREKEGVWRQSWDIQPYETNQFVRYILYGQIDHALLVKSGELNDQTDAVQMVDGNGNTIIPASTIKGLFRSYGKKILATLEYSEDLIEKLFGADIESNQKQMGQIFAKDSIIQDAKEKLYHRIKIDRFTGGAINGAKFDEKPVWGKVQIELLYKKQEEETIDQTARALLFLTMRDLAQGRLPIGSGSSVGYGRLKGRELLIIDGNETESILLENTITCKNPMSKERLEKSIEVLKGGRPYESTSGR